MARKIAWRVEMVIDGLFMFNESPAGFFIMLRNSLSEAMVVYGDGEGRCRSSRQ